MPPQRHGYVVTFDLRDPGEYVLQILVTWYYAGTDPEELPVPICVGSHIGHHYRSKDGVRAQVFLGSIVKVSLSESAAVPTAEAPRWGDTKCDRGDLLGRWVNMEDRPCEPPYCTGDRKSTVNGLDVRALCHCALASEYE